MDMGDKDKHELEKRNEDSFNNYHSPSISPDWRYGGGNIANTSMGLDLMGSSSCSSAPMVNSFCPTVWDHPSNSQTLGFCDLINSSTSSPLGIRKGVPGSGWNPQSSILKGDIFLPNSPMVPQSLSQFPTDSGFIERAARFSCFNGGTIGDMMNPFGISESVGPYSRGGPSMVQGHQEVFVGNGLKPISGGQSQKNETAMVEASKAVSLSVEHVGSEGSPLKNLMRSENFLRSRDEAKQGEDESDEAEFSGGQDDRSDPSSTKGLVAGKRKRGSQDAEANQLKGAQKQIGDALKDNIEAQQKVDQNSNKLTGKQGNKQGSQASDSVKEDYIHVRARRGQATNSHSLAERVRREKISERMKFLQDLVPGCSKVTGKAVMLDEIINYVQSLQRQVEFLSMKLATVNPRLDFNIEGLLAKEILQSRAGPPSTLGFSPEMAMAAYPQLHPSQPGLIQQGLPGMGSSSDLLRRTIGTQLTSLTGGYKDPTSQLPNMWEDDELHNVVQMSFGVGAPLNTQNINGSLPEGHMKVEQ